MLGDVQVRKGGKPDIPSVATALLPRLAVKRSRLRIFSQTAAHHGQSQRIPESRGARNAGRRTGADPYRQLFLRRARRNLRIVKRRPEPPGPAHALLRVEHREQAEFFDEKLIVLVQIVAEEWKVVEERTAPEDD